MFYILYDYDGLYIYLFYSKMNKRNTRWMGEDYNNVFVWLYDYKTQSQRIVLMMVTLLLHMKQNSHTNILKRTHTNLCAFLEHLSTHRKQFLYAKSPYNASFWNATIGVNFYLLLSLIYPKLWNLVYCNKVLPMRTVHIAHTGDKSETCGRIMYTIPR